MLVSVPATGTVPDPLATLGGFRWYLGHQHRFHTLVTHVRGPAEPDTFGRCAIAAAIPAGLGPGGNVPVYVEVLSYAGSLTLTTTVDPDGFPELGDLTGALRAELELVVTPPA